MLPLIFAQISNMGSKKASESIIIMTELVLPNDTNLFMNLLGGGLLY